MLVFNTIHGFDALLESVFDHAHLCNGIGDLDQLGWCCTAGNDDVLHGGALLQCCNNGGELEPAEFERIRKLVQDHQVYGWIGKLFTDFLPCDECCAFVAFAILRFPREPLTHHLP